MSSIVPSTPAGFQNLCEPSLPIEVEWIPLNTPAVGRTTRFRIIVESHLDPDLVREVRMEYDLPPHWLRPAALREQEQVINKSGRNSLELGLIIPDEGRYELKARVVLTLRNGRRLSQTAPHWVDLGSKDLPTGMIGRIENSDGSGIRVYQGATIGERE